MGDVKRSNLVIGRHSAAFAGPTRRWGPLAFAYLAIGGARIQAARLITLPDALPASSVDGRNMIIIGNSLIQIAGATNSCTIIHVHKNLANLILYEYMVTQIIVNFKSARLVTCSATIDMFQVRRY